MSKERLASIGIALESDYDMFIAMNRLDPSFGEYLGAKVGQGFDFTTTRLMMEEAEITRAEVEAYGYREAVLNPNDEYMPEALRALGSSLLRDSKSQRDPNEIQAPVKLTNEQYRESEYYREGVKWRDGWTEARARVMAEQYDRRRYRDAVIANADVGAGGAALGFLASMAGSLPDPINLIPFGAGFSKARLGGKLLAGMAEGALGNAAVNAVVFPDLIARGEELGFIDFAGDIVAGGLLGSGLAGAGHLFSRGLNARASRMAGSFNESIKDAAEVTGTEIPGFHTRAIARLEDLGMDTNPRVTLDGTEMDTHLGGPEWKEIDKLPHEQYLLAIKDLRKKAEFYYTNNIQQQAWQSPLGDVKMTGKGKNEAFQKIADLEKLMLFPALRNTIENPVYILRQPPKHTGRKDQINQFFRYYGVAELKGEKYLVSAIVGRDDKGKLFYDLNPKDEDFFIDAPVTQASPDEFASGSGLMALKNDLPPTQALPEATTRGPELAAHRNVPDSNISKIDDDVNFFVHNADDLADLAASRPDTSKAVLRQSLHGADKAAGYNAVDKAVADFTDGAPVDVKPVMEKMPAYQNLSEARQMDLFPQEARPAKAETPDPKLADENMEAYGLEALDEIDRMDAEGLLRDDEKMMAEQADADVKKAESVKSAVRSFVGCMFGL